MSGVSRRRALIRELKPSPWVFRRRAELTARRFALSQWERSELKLLEKRVAPWFDLSYRETIRWMNRLRKMNLPEMCPAKKALWLEMDKISGDKCWAQNLLQLTWVALLRPHLFDWQRGHLDPSVLDWK